MSADAAFLRKMARDQDGDDLDCLLDIADRIDLMQLENESLRNLIQRINEKFAYSSNLG